MRLWYLSDWRPAKAQAILHIRTVLPEPPLFAHIKYGSRKNVQPKIRHLTQLDSKKISNAQEPIESDPTSCPQNQKGNN